MKRKLYKESVIALLVILIFDFLRLLYVINYGEISFFDIAWILLLMFIVFINYQSKREENYIHIICLGIGIFPILFMFLNSLQIITNGLEFTFNNYFMIFEAVLISAIVIYHLVGFVKYLKENNNNE